jgi:hypothetical protein
MPRRPALGLAAGSALLAALVVLSPAAANAAPFRFERLDIPALDKPGALANAWADYDGDGDLDLATGFKDGSVVLLRNDRGRLKPSGVQFEVGGRDARALAWGDYDTDGDVDLYVGTSATPRHRNRLFRNDGGGRFAEVSEAVGVSPAGATTRQTSWIDIDRDGDLELFVAQRAGANQLFRNEAGRFRDVAAELGLADPRKTVGACFFDGDQDGDLDLFVANQAGDRDGYFRNDDGRFVDVAEALGLTPLERPAADGSVGCAVGDYDNDGDFDLFVAAYGKNRLYRNAGGTFTEVAEAVGIRGEDHYVAGGWADVDQDGWLDLYVTTFRTPNPTLKDHLYRNQAGQFVDELPASLDVVPADHGVQWADLDGDGALDLALTHNDDKVGAGRVYRNETPDPAHRGAIKVAAVNARGTGVVPGAEVRLFDAAGRLLGARMMDTGGGYDSQNAMPVHFATLGARRVTVSVTFLTPEGRRTVTRRDVDPAKFRDRPLVVRQPRP